MRGGPYLLLQYLFLVRHKIHLNGSCSFSIQCDPARTRSSFVCFLPSSQPDLSPRNPNVSPCLLCVIMELVIMENQVYDGFHPKFFTADQLALLSTTFRHHSRPRSK